MTKTGTALFFGRLYADSYESEELLEMLKSDDVSEIYKALGAIGKLKLKETLDRLKYMAVYDEDLGIQDEAVRTIRRIGGRKAMDVLHSLKTTDHKELINMILKHGADFKE